MLAVIGDNDPSKIHFLKRCRDFREMCESCRTKHVYTRADVREENVARRETLPQPSFSGSYSTLNFHPPYLYLDQNSKLVADTICPNLAARACHGPVRAES